MSCSVVDDGGTPPFHQSGVQRESPKQRKLLHAGAMSCSVVDDGGLMLRSPQGDYDNRETFHR